MVIIGITGTIGAGKGTIVDYLVKNLNFKHFSVRSFLIEEINRRSMTINRDSLVNVANDLRAKYSPAYIVEQLYKRAKKSKLNCIIESIRTAGEVELLRSKENFYLLAVDADSKIRYERIHLRSSETDNISYEEFIINEQREYSSADPNKQNLSKCIEMADYKIENNKTLNYFHTQLDKILKEIKFYE